MTDIYLDGIFTPALEAARSSAHSVQRIYSLAPFKIDTVGDAYVVAILLDRPTQSDQRYATIKMMNVARAIAWEVMAYSHTGPHGTEPGSVKMRMGCCLGQAVSGLVGLKKPRYHVMGDALNRATELESKSLAWNVHMDECTCSYLEHLEGNVFVDLRPSADSSQEEAIR